MPLHVVGLDASLTTQRVQRTGESTVDNTRGNRHLESKCGKPCGIGNYYTLSDRSPKSSFNSFSSKWEGWEITFLLLAKSKATYSSNSFLSFCYFRRT